ncbi:MAG: hypothetical protein JO335_11740 [Sphingomonas sp.]|nr:hypothetical protein [Sphingomonas sp.]
MSDPLEFVPVYLSPLTDKQHAQIGRIAVLWGQIEYFVEILMAHVSHLSWDELTAVGVTEKPIGAKVLFLKAATARIAEVELRQRVREFCESIDDTKVARNHVFHGIWGWRGDKKSHRIFPAARKTSDPSRPFKASQLAVLEKRLCKSARLGGNLAMHYWGDPDTELKYCRFFHHGDKEAIPQWFSRWSARNPVPCDALDRTSKAGQLPRLDAPFPER